MVKGMALLLGVGLFILGLAGLSEMSTRGWMTWMDLVAAVGCFVLAGAIRDNGDREIRVGGPLALALGLGIMWVVGLSTAVPSWLTWWNFAFAVAFMLVGIGGTAEKSSVESRDTVSPFDVDRYRRHG